jgi:hypothetical protein
MILMVVFQKHGFFNTLLEAKTRGNHEAAPPAREARQGVCIGG